MRVRHCELAQEIATKLDLTEFTPVQDFMSSDKIYKKQQDELISDIFERLQKSEIKLMEIEPTLTKIFSDDLTKLEKSLKREIKMDVLKLDELHREITDRSR